MGMMQILSVSTRKPGCFSQFSILLLTPVSQVCLAWSLLIHAHSLVPKNRKQ